MNKKLFSIRYYLFNLLFGLALGFQIALIIREFIWIRIVSILVLCIAWLWIRSLQVRSYKAMYGDLK